MSTVVMWTPKDKISQHSSPASSYYNLLPFILNTPWALEVGSDMDVLLMGKWVWRWGGSERSGCAGTNMIKIYSVKKEMKEIQVLHFDQKKKRLIFLMLTR